jgi:hypothetical protein
MILIKNNLEKYFSHKDEINSLVKKKANDLMNFWKLKYKEILNEIEKDYYFAEMDKYHIEYVAEDYYDEYSRECYLEHKYFPIEWLYDDTWQDTILKEIYKIRDEKLIKKLEK